MGLSTVQPVRVLVVDDAVVIRRFLSEIIQADPDLELAAVAANGKIALARIEQLNPDVVTLDVEMPEMDGLETLAEIRRTRPELPVIMFSTLTERGAAATIEALRLGATDYVTKPAGMSSAEDSVARVRAELVPRLKALVRPAPRGAAHVPAPVVSPSSPCRPAEVVAIGCSTGGPNALGRILTALDSKLGVPIVVTQHMPPVFTRFLSERLDKDSGLTVVEASEGLAVEPDTVVIAEGDHHLEFRREGTQVRCHLDGASPEHSCRPAVDVMFRSVAQVWGAGALALVLTGMGNDGTDGARALRARGAQVLVQDHDSSVVWGMPGSVVAAGEADAVVALDAMADEIQVRVGRFAPRESVGS